MQEQDVLVLYRRTSTESVSTENGQTVEAMSSSPSALAVYHEVGSAALVESLQARGSSHAWSLLQA